MKNILPLRSGIDVKPLSLALRRNPQLWNDNNQRTKSQDSPHLEVDDIWVRYNPDLTNSGPHESLWYSAVDLLPEVKDIVYPLMAMVKGERLGGVLITRIPASRRVYPHMDLGWHAEKYQKFAVQIESHPQQHFAFEDGTLITAPGDVYWFNNQSLHWVNNDSPVDRITLIVCIETDTYERVEKLCLGL